MKRRGAGMILMIFPVLLLMFSPNAIARKDDYNRKSQGRLDYQFARWRGFKHSAFSITFDDNYRYQFSKALPFLNQHNYKATYFIVTNRVGKGYSPGWDTLNMVALQGHEIGSHSRNHPDFVTLTQNPAYADSMKAEFRGSRDTINARIPSQQCVTFAWPFGSVNTQAIEVAKDYYMACRGSINQFEGGVPYNYYNIYSQHIYHDTPLETVNGYIDTIIAQQGLLVERWHGFRVMHDTDGYEPVPVGEFASHFDYVAMHEDDLWVATLGDVVKYMRERDTSRLDFVDSTGYRVLLRLHHNLPDSLGRYDVPLTVRLRLYGKMADVYMITQDNETLPWSISYQGSTKYIYFDAVPNNGLIVFHLPDPVGIDEGIAPADGAVNYPNPFVTSTTIVFDNPGSGFVSMLVFDQSGRMVRDLSRQYLQGRNAIEFDGRGLSPGLYTCIIESRDRRRVLRMLLTH